MKPRKTTSNKIPPYTVEEIFWIAPLIVYFPISLTFFYFYFKQIDSPFHTHES